jgi:hypothetical protein
MGVSVLAFVRCIPKMLARLPAARSSPLLAFVTAENCEFQRRREAAGELRSALREVAGLSVIKSAETWKNAADSWKASGTGSSRTQADPVFQREPQPIPCLPIV